MEDLWEFSNISIQESAVETTVAPSLQDIGRDRAAWLKTRVWKKRCGSAAERISVNSPGQLWPQWDQVSSVAGILACEIASLHQTVQCCSVVISVPQNSRSLQASRSQSGQYLLFQSPSFFTCGNTPFLALFSFPHPTAAVLLLQFFTWICLAEI